MRKILYNRFVANGLFWSWNLILFTTIVTLEISEGVFTSFIFNPEAHFAPTSYKFLGALMVLGPLLSMGLAAQFLVKKPDKLIKFFYGFELPLGLLVLFRFIVLRDLVPSSSQFMWVFVLAVISYGTEVFWGISEKKWLGYLQLVGHTFLVWVTLFVSILILLYVIPTLWAGLKLLPDAFEAIFTAGSFIEFILLIFGLFSVTLFVFMPLAMIILYPRAVQRMVGARMSYGVVLMMFVLALNGFMFYRFNFKQPQKQAFEWVDKYKTSHDQAILKENDKKIKKGLLNAYLASMRYLGEVDKDQLITKIYNDEFNISIENLRWLQNIHTFLIRPFMYEGDWREDKRKAEKIYEKMFDAGIQQGNKQEIINAVRSNWQWDLAGSDILDINERKVHIDAQDIIVTDKGNVAEIEFHESYTNYAPDVEEIFYYFTLPEYAVITGMWLSDDSTIKKYPYSVSPRGAAQEVYKNQVRRNNDPSLLEMVGPGKYRLRVFPILPERDRWQRRSSRFAPADVDWVRPQMHLWIRYQVLKNNESVFELPHLVERRNAYWDDDTKLTINGKEQDKGDDWMPADMPAEEKGDYSPMQVALDSGMYFEIKRSLGYVTKGKLQYKKQGLILDATYSMNKYKGLITKYLHQIKEQGLLEGNDKIYLVSDTVLSMTLDQLITEIGQGDHCFTGSNGYMEMIKLLHAHVPSIGYKSMIFITDEGSYELEDDNLDPVRLGFELNLVHLPDCEAPIYQDAFLETVMNSGGTIHRSLDEFNWAQKERDKTPGFLSAGNGIVFSRLPELTQAPDDGLNPIMAGAYISSAQTLSDTNRLKVLDYLHDLAIKYSVVTPYSSMIVLVNDVQKQQLEEAENMEDRFDRESEKGSKALQTNSDQFEVSGVPEPHEWLMLGVVAIALMLLTFKRRYS